MNFLAKTMHQKHVCLSENLAQLKTNFSQVSSLQNNASIWALRRHLRNKTSRKQSSLFNVRYDFPNLINHEGNENVIFVGFVNRECKKFLVQLLTEDQIKCFISFSDFNLLTKLM